MVEKREWRWVALVALGVMAAVSLPYVAAWAAAPPATHFTGLLYNPLDGHTYIAKMRLGAAGSWLFRLTYTPEPHHGAPVYLFYLFLGHVARWTGLPLLAVYHGTRLAGGAAFLAALYCLVAHVTDRVFWRRRFFLLGLLASGLGWLAVLFGHQTPDLWVAEAFPFVALLTNAHFPVALALMAGAACWGLAAQTSHRAGAALVLAAVALGAIQPFGLLPLFGGLAGSLLLSWLHQSRFPWRGVAWSGAAALLALPYPLYTLWALQSDPLLAAWNAQNITPSPPWWDWLLALGLLAPLALVGAVAAARRREPIDGLLLGWLLTTAVGLALPLDLARRLSIGLGLVVGPLAGWGWLPIVRARPRLASVPLAAALLTPLFLLALGAGAALGGQPLLYLSDGEWQALSWLRDHVEADAVVLCAPETGLFVPAWAGQRVVYGHPFETVHADQRRAQVERFWAGERDAAALDRLGVTHVFYGPRERALGAPPDGTLLFATEDTAIYRR